MYVIVRLQIYEQKKYPPSGGFFGGGIYEN